MTKVRKVAIKKRHSPARIQKGIPGRRSARPRHFIFWFSIASWRNTVSLPEGLMNWDEKGVLHCAEKTTPHVAHMISLNFLTNSIFAMRNEGPPAYLSYVEIMLSHTYHFENIPQQMTVLNSPNPVVHKLILVRLQ